MNESPDPFEEQMKAEELAELRAWSRGCLLGSLLPAGLTILGLFLGNSLFAGDADELQNNRVMGTVCLLAAIGFITGAWSFLRVVAPGVYLRGLFGLPDLPVTPRAEQMGVQNQRGLRVFIGFVAGLVVVLIMLSVVSFTMTVNPGLGNMLLWAALLLGPLVGVLVGWRTGLRPPLEEIYE